MIKYLKLNKYNNSFKKVNFMIIYRKDRRGLQDILSKTTVVNK